MRVLAACLLLALPAAPEELGRPRHNTSYVPDDDPATRALVAEAAEAARAGRPEAAADRLQALLVGAPGGLVPLREGLMYVSPRRWAHLALVGGPPPFGPDVLAAWRDVHDRNASALLRLAIGRGDEDEILRLLDLYPAATDAPSALLALADRAVQRGDAGAALGYLLRVPEHVPPAEAALLDAPPYRTRRAYVDALPRPRPAGWPTAGGDAARARNGDPLPENPVRLWETPFLEAPPSSLREPFLLPAARRPRSPDLPFEAVCDARRLYVALGPCVAAMDRSNGKLLWFAPEGSFPDPMEIDALVDRNPGPRGATVEGGVLYFPRVLFAGEEPLRRNVLVAFDVERQRTLWQAPRPGGGASPLLKRPLFFRGAPAVAEGRLYAYVAVREDGEVGPTRKEEAYVVCLDAADGRLLWERFLGYATTRASPRFPPLSGLAPALSGGVVVAVTGHGVAAALDARTGDVLWLFRYDRSRGPETQRLAEDTEEETVHLDEGWKWEPPRIAGDTVWFAPFDSDEMFSCWLRGARGRDGGTYVEQWAKERDRGHGRHSGLEYVAGFAHGRIYYVGRRDARAGFEESYKPVISHPMDRTDGWSCGILPATVRDGETGRMVPPDPYGRPAIAGDVLLLPTIDTLYRFDVSGGPRERLVDGELRREVPYLPPFPAPVAVAEDEPRPAAFGNLVAVDGFLYAVTPDRVICYGTK